MEAIAEGDTDYDTSSLSSHKESNHKEKILVSVRLRPINDKERARNDACDWECINNSTIVFKSSLPERNMFPSAYTYDRVFGSESSTDQVYEYGAKEVALAVVNGINASIFAYGQTSSGKTYTMSGVTEYAVADIFKYIEKHPDREYVLKFSAMEIYNEAVRDLLSIDGTPLRLLDDPERGTVVEKLTEEAVADWNHFLELMEVCQAQRHIGETSLNEMSSRSHQIVRLTVESSSVEFLGPDNPSSLAACVNFIDLAGSERASQTMAVGARLKEGSHINRSLLTLGTVIRKLSKGRTGHVPYRDSKLTRILQNSLGGNARTAIICTMSPARSHVEQSRNTLLFASCAKEVTTNAQVNLVMSDKVLVKQLQRELARMERELRSFGSSSTSYNSTDLLREKEAQIELMDNKINELNRQLELAQSRIDDLQRSTSESKQEGSSTSGSPDNRNFLDNKKPHHADKGNRTDKNYERLNSSKSNLDFADNTEDNFLIDGLSPQISTCTPNTEDPNIPAKPDAEEVFKDVQCIEVKEPKKAQCLAEQETIFPDQEEMDRKREAVEATKNDNNNVDSVTYDSLRNKIQEMQKTIDNIVNIYPVEEGNNPSGSQAVEAPNPTVKRSRSSRSLLMGIAPYRTPAGSEVGFAGSTVCGIPHRYAGSTRGSVVSFRTEVTEFTDIRSFNNCAVERNRGVDVHLKQVDESESEDDEDEQDQEVMVQRYAWESEFNIRRAKIMELWQVCNVSLVHRSYFFLLFEGDPSDLHYLEVEMRRLNFLKNSMFGRSQNSTLGASIKALNKERESLSRRIQKKFSSNKEKETLYKKWNIDLNTKLRSVQLAKRLWTEPKDIIHVKESAQLIELLVGVFEAKKVPKEIFGLSFSPEPLLSRRPSMWTSGASSSLGVSSTLGVSSILGISP